MGYSNMTKFKVTIKKPIYQAIAETKYEDTFQQVNIPLGSMTVSEFQKLATSEKYSPPAHKTYDELEQIYWRDMTSHHGIYGADVNGSLTDSNLEYWNINKLGSILDFVEKDYNISIDGVNTSYLYFGMYKTSFAWHTEDMDLYSINYLHFGAPKTWYAIPPKFSKKFEDIAKSIFPKTYKICPAFLRHKMTIINPMFLSHLDIPFNKITQEAGHFMITFPYSYHSGFNHGFNCAESTNFADERWIEYGKQASICYCCPDAVKIPMDEFVKRFQPQNYTNWMNGKDHTPHPEHKQPYKRQNSKNLYKKVSFKDRNPELDILNLLENPTIDEEVREELKTSYEVSAEDEVKIMIDEIEAKQSTEDSSEDERPQRRRSKKDFDYDDDWFETKGHEYVNEDGTIRRSSTRKRVPSKKVISNMESDEDSSSSIERPVRKKRATPVKSKTPKTPAEKKVIKIKPETKKQESKFEKDGGLVETIQVEDKKVTVFVCKPSSLPIPKPPKVQPPTTPVIKPNVAPKTSSSNPNSGGFENAFAAFLSAKKDVAEQPTKTVKRPANKSGVGRKPKNAETLSPSKIIDPTNPTATPVEKSNPSELIVVKPTISSISNEYDRVRTEKISIMHPSFQKSIVPSQKISYENGQICVVPSTSIQT
jgi:[histone H3]-trimethyl-L-lysine9/36 demethylase